MTNVIPAALQFLSAAAVGLYAGSMLTEGAVLVPYWRAAPPAEFLAWYSVNARRLPAFFGPVTWIAGLLSLAAAVAAQATVHPGRWSALLAAGLMVLAAATFYVYFGRANARFAARTLAPHELSAELRRWAAWHLGRTVVAMAAFVAALLSLARVG